MPLFWAAEYGLLAIMKVLLEHGVDINAINYEDGTPLGWLIHAGNPDNNIATTEAYMRERGVKEEKLRGVKVAWIWLLTYSQLLQYVCPSI